MARNGWSRWAKCALGRFGVAEPASPVGVAAAFEDVARGIDGIESVLGVGGEGASERLEFRDNGLTPLVGFVLEDGDVAIAIKLDIPVVSRGQLRDTDLESGPVGGWATSITNSHGRQLDLPIDLVG